MGRIRVHESRTVLGSSQISVECFHLLLSIAPDSFPFNETSGFLIAEYKNLQPEIEGSRPPGYECGVWWLLLKDVIRFFPLRADDSWVFESDAEKAQVVLDKAAFEPQWEQWLKAQSVEQACINGMALNRAFDFGCVPATDANGIELWRALAGQIVAPNSDDPDITNFSGMFLNNCDRLFELVMEDYDSGSIFVSCPIEWINLRSDTNILDMDADLAERADSLYKKYRNEPFEASLACAEDLTEFAALVRTKVPDAFPGEWSPVTITFYVRYRHRIRWGSFLPDDIVDAVRAVEMTDGQRTAALLAFLLGVALGSNKTHNLERILHREKFVVATTEPDSFGLMGPSVDENIGTGPKH